jgi:hypothetical protein
MRIEQRTHGETLIADQVPLPSLLTWLGANRSRFKQNSVNEVLIMHDHGCGYPWGEPCACVPGPQITVAGEVATDN